MDFEMTEKQSGFLDSFTLKMIAIISMLADHIGYIFFPQDMVFRAVGRIAFPIFCFLIVEGFHHTRNHTNYLIRLCIFAIISEIPFDLAFFGTLMDWGHQNVFLTLAFGLAAIFCLEEMNTKRIYAIPFVLIFAASYFVHCDYGIGGVLLICMFYLTRETPWMRFILTALILYIFYGSFELYGLIAMVFITFYNGKRGPQVKMLFYWFYPVHLLVLYAIAHYL